MEHGYLKDLEGRITFLKQSRHWDGNAMAGHQLAELKDLLAHAYANVPYYRRVFDDIGFDPAAVTSLEDLQSLPVIDKDVIKANHDDFIAQNYDRDALSTMSTGGSTGNPLLIYVDERFRAYNHANTYFHTDVLCGERYIRSNRPSVRLHGDVLPKELTEAGTFFEYRDNKLVLSSFHLDEHTTADFVAEMARLKPDYLHAYPSAVNLLADYIERLDLTLDFQLEVVFCDSEKLYGYQRERIERVFSCPVIEVYGHTEGAVFGMQCEHSTNIHILPQVGIFELIKPDGSFATEPGERGEVVVTGFNNRVMPFIRYRTGDIGVLAEQECACGTVGVKLAEVEGRLQDFAVDRRGGLVAIGPTLFDYNIDWSGIDRYQIYQDTEGKLLFRLRLTEHFEGRDEEVRSRFDTAMNANFGDRFIIETVVVPETGFTRIGKYRYLDQKLDMRKYL